ncbi:MBL fold metallo-hydrolase [bacterium]|nr:MBL fold metallo-hydrolase [bacterium]
MQKDLLAEHGLAVGIEYKSYKVLFDTGQTNILRHNAKHLDIDVEKTKAIVLSHGHYDHTGGLKEILTIAKRPQVYIHPNGFENKYSCSEDGLAREIGMPDLDEAAVRHLAGDIIWTKQPVEIHPGLWVTGEILREANLEDVGGSFFTDDKCLKKDTLPDDQALYFKSELGLVVILGCAHAGVVNTLNYIRKITGYEPIYCVMGGMHLINATEERIQFTINALYEMGIEKIGLAHCTGYEAVYRFKKKLLGRCFACPVGTMMEFRL